jgi:hypothetical protein
MYMPKNYLLRHMITLGSVNGDVYTGVSTISTVHLLLVICTPFATPLSILWLGLEKGK